MGKVKCFAKTFKIPSENKLREWSHDKYEETRQKLFRKANVGCEEFAFEKQMEFQEARANALGTTRLLPEVVPEMAPEVVPEPQSADLIEQTPSKSPRSSHSKYKEFRTRNNVEFKRDIVDRFGNSIYDAGHSIMNVSKGAFNSIHGIGKLGVHGYRTGTKKIGKLQRGWVNRKLKNCTVRCDSIDDCCTENEIKQLIRDLAAIDTNIIRNEEDKLKNRIQEATDYAETLDVSERQEFLVETEEKLRKELHDNLKEAMETIKDVYDPFEQLK